MTIDTNTMVSISEANQNFSKVARLVDECGSAVILKNRIFQNSISRRVFYGIFNKVNLDTGDTGEPHSSRN